MASYDDLMKEPSRPAHISDITNLIGYFKEHGAETRYQDVSGIKPPIASDRSCCLKSVTGAQVELRRPKNALHSKLMKNL